MGIQDLLQATWLLNTDTGLLYIQNGRINPAPFLVLYQPTLAEIQAGRKNETPVAAPVATVTVAGESDDVPDSLVEYTAEEAEEEPVRRPRGRRKGSR